MALYPFQQFSLHLEHLLKALSLLSLDIWMQRCQLFCLIIKEYTSRWIHTSNKALTLLRKSALTCRKAELAFFVSFFYQGFFSRISWFTGQQGKGEAISLTSLYHCCRELTYAHSWQPDSSQKPSVSYQKSRPP